MNKNPFWAFVLASFVIMIAAPAFPAEELFDTATATKHMDQGISLLKVKKFDAAIREFEESASINPDAEAYYYLGYAYYLKGRNGDEESRKKSRENFNKAYEIDPHFSPARYKPAETLPPAGQEAPQPAPQTGPTTSTP